MRWARHPGRACLRQSPRRKKRGKLANSCFFWTQLDVGSWFGDETEFANRGKLTWQTGKLNDRLGTRCEGSFFAIMMANWPSRTGSAPRFLLFHHRGAVMVAPSHYRLPVLLLV